MATDYEDFEVQIGAVGADGIYPVTVFSSPAGPATGTIKLDLKAEDLISDLASVCGIDSNLALRQSFGLRLFKALFNGSIRDTWMTSKGLVEADKAGLRLRLWINAPQLATLPWELIYEQDFLATSSALAVSRYLPVPEPPFYAVQLPLRILAMIENPSGLDRLGLGRIDKSEIDAFESVMRALEKRVVYKILENATVAQIQDELQRDYHVLHFIGHGTSGKLFLTADDGEDVLPIEDLAFAQLFSGRRSLRLVVLNACKSAQSRGGELFSGIGPALVRKRVPAVVAMQYPFVLLDTASRFSQRFYGSLANGLPVDVAVNEARQYISAGRLLGDRDWSTPVLYMGTRRGQIMNLMTDDKDSVQRAWHSVQRAAQIDAEASAALTELSQRFQELARYHESIRALLETLDSLRDIREDFSSCARLIESSPVLNLRDLAREWDRVRQRQFVHLETLAGRSPSGTATWFDSLRTRAREIDTSIEEKAFGTVDSAVRGFNSSLAQAEASVQEGLDDALKNLIALSNRTLGQLRLE